MADDTHAWLNYHHLFYFYRVARAGSVSTAAKELRMSHSTLSVQVRDLGERLGGPLFERRGRGLVLTSRGEQVLGYADDIFRLGRELAEVALGDRTLPRGLPSRVGVVPALPRTLVHELLEPALDRHHGPLLLRSDGLHRLLEELSSGRLHLVLSDVPPPATTPGTHVHMLGRSGVALFASKKVAARLRPSFPASLDDAPMVMPAPGSGLRRLLDRWFAERRVRPRVVAEADDAAMLRVMGLRGHGAFPVRLALRAEVDDVPGLARVGSFAGIEETYYAVTSERRVRHPFVAALVQHAREALKVAPGRRG
jgi:LysR family transcriptional activator of nhaA